MLVMKILGYVGLWLLVVAVIICICSAGSGEPKSPEEVDEGLDEDDG